MAPHKGGDSLYPALQPGPVAQQQPQQIRALALKRPLRLCASPSPSIERNVDGDLTCRVMGKDTMSGLFKEGDLVIGGVFPVFGGIEQIHTLFKTEPPRANCIGQFHPERRSCELVLLSQTPQLGLLTYCVSNRFDLRAFQWVQMMVFAVEEINMNNKLLPNITLGYRILDNCASPAETARAGLLLANKPEEGEYVSSCPSPITAFITSNSLNIARAIGGFGIPLVSYTSTCSCLSNKREFPTFSRTIPSDFFQAKALAQLVKHFGWTWIGVIQADSEYGIVGVQSFTKEVVKHGVCIAFTENIFSTYSATKILHLLDTIKKSTVKVILAFASERDLRVLMQEIVRQNITGIQWIASEAWITAARPSTVEFFRSFGGTIGFAIRKMAIPPFKEFLLNIRPSLDSANNLNNIFWEYIFGCTLRLKVESFQQNVSDTKICTGQERLDKIENAFFDVSQLRESYNVHNAVYAVAHALHDLLFCEKEENNTIRLCGDIARIEPWQVSKMKLQVKSLSLLLQLH
ncbi:extracellular calcium-sensing receptor-like [Lepisosteus oculatus]|uniref:extracellular calcium-sensing receptor-like n=1 Tax=Lepisosteus oculatus TaxID=7918 RepID=UPI0035F510B0